MLTKEEAAERLIIHEQTLIRWAEHGLIARHAYNDHGEYLYEEPAPGMPVKHRSRWDRVVDRKPAVREETASKSSRSSGKDAV